jgi:hypothetical protein
VDGTRPKTATSTIAFLAFRRRRAPHPALRATLSRGERDVGEFDTRGTIAAEDEAVLPEVFECPQCKRQFVFDLVENGEDRSIHCPQCKRYLGEKDIHFVMVSEIEELAERLRFERDRLEKDEAVYSMTDCDAELRLYGTEVHKVVNILRRTLAELEALKQQYR